ncbi:MAG TPA: 6-phosphogluconolactonase [Paludibacteraceae bacterium]|nr:6-phosphogluconolactonase [Paludibacteraceae bacterium]
MKQSNIYIFDTPADAAKAIAQLILNRVSEKQNLSYAFNLAISGGKTPETLFGILANDFAEKIPWHQLRLFWVDERCVPPTHPESNFGMTNETLLKKVDLPRKNIFRMKGEAAPEEEAIRYQSVLTKELPSKNGIPVFNLILLGMGNDGHTASIFPKDMDLIDNHLSVAVTRHPDTGQKRITLTGPVLKQAEEIIFFITGAQKATILKEMLLNEPSAKKYPAFHISSAAEKTSFYLDKEASALLPKEIQSAI